MAFDNGEKIDNPMFLKKSQYKLGKHQQELATLERGTTRYRSKQEQITKLYAKITR